MHRYVRHLASALLVLGVSGCSKDLCDRTAEKYEECGEEISDAEFQSCKDSIADCDGGDMDLLEDFTDCMEDAGMFACATDDTGTSDDDDFEALMACSMPLAGLSDACLESMNSGTTTTTYYY